MKTKLEIGCGQFKKELKQEDTIYLDIRPFENIDIVRDIEKGLPFADETFEYIKAHHVMEHLKDLIFVMNECWRVLKPGATLDIEVPVGQNAWIDPTHIRGFTVNSFNFFLIKDFNSWNSGVVGYFDVKEILHKGESEDDIRGLQFLLVKKV